MAEKVFISGQGIISAIGNSVDEVFASLVGEKSGIGYTSFIDTVYRNEIPLAEVQLSNEELLLNIPKHKRSGIYTRATLMGIWAVNEALRSARLDDVAGARTGFISSTSVGGMDKTENFFAEYITDVNKGRLRNVAGHDCGDSTEAIARYFNISGFVTTISTACSSAANAIMLGARMIQSGLLDRVIVGGVDALTKFTMNGFNTLMILDRDPCRPFDETRKGLNIGEGAAYLVLESESIVSESKKDVLGIVSGFGNACDAFHQTASSPEGTGPRLAIQKAILTAGLQPDEISYINVHGTGTPNNDLSEGKALEEVFNMKVPPFSSTKSFTGHTLGAAGSIEAVISLLAIQNNIIFPNLNFSTRIKDLTISPESELIKNVEVKHVLSNSFGFGGNNTSLIFSKFTL